MERDTGKAKKEKKKRKRTTAKEMDDVKQWERQT